jgi:hypothetical protein
MSQFWRAINLPHRTGKSLAWNVLLAAYKIQRVVFSVADGQICIPFVKFQIL